MLSSMCIEVQNYIFGDVFAIYRKSVMSFLADQFFCSYAGFVQLQAIKCHVACRLHGPRAVKRIPKKRDRLNKPSDILERISCKLKLISIPFKTAIFCFDFIILLNRVIILNNMQSL